MKISLIHMKTRNSMAQLLSAAQKRICEAAKQKPNFIALPEYFSVPGFIENFSSAEEIFKKHTIQPLNFWKASQRNFQKPTL
ncbi:MAG: hypothetical protein ACUVTE_05315 [Candidatus Bathycorpusculaceae bacterium]